MNGAFVCPVDDREAKPNNHSEEYNHRSFVIKFTWESSFCGGGGRSEKSVAGLLLRKLTLSYSSKRHSASHLV